MAWRKVWKVRRKGGRKNGWLLRWYDDAGKMKAKTVYGSAEEADDECRALEEQLNAGALSRRRNIAWLDFCQEYLAELASCRRPRTVEECRKVLGQLTDFCQPQELQDVTPVLLKRFVRQQTDGNSPATRNKLIRTLRAVFSTAVPDSLPVNPALKIEFAGEPEQDHRTLDPAELERMLAVADERGKVVLLLGTCCGLRREEIAPLRWEDVDLVRGSLRVRNSIWHTTKSGRQREALMPPALCSLLATMKTTSKSEFVLPNVYLSYRELPNQIRKIWTKAHAAAKKSGDRREQARQRAWRAVGNVQHWDRPIEPNRLTDLVPRLAKQAGVEHCTLHDLRRTFCSYLAACGTDVLAAQKLAGHSNPAVTAKYYVRIVPETLRAQTQLPHWDVQLNGADQRHSDASLMPIHGALSATETAL